VFFFLPIGLDQTSVRRLPWVSLAIIAINVVVFLVVGTAVRSVEEEINRRGQAVMAYWAQHPYLEFPARMLPAGMSEAQREKVALLTESVKSISGSAPESMEQRAQEQQELDRLVAAFQEALGDHPFKAWGLVPAHPQALAFLTSLFMHAGWMHLLGNMLFLYLSGPFVEDAFGRPLFAGLYLASGAVSSLVHIAAFPGSEAPLVGASGAVAGVMGAFLVRFVRTKIRFFYAYFIFVFRTGTVDLPAWIVLPLWFLQQVFFAGLTAESGVAYRAHVGGFAFGFLAALAIKYLRIEERFVAPGIEKAISVTQHPDLDRGMELLARGDTRGARVAFQRVLTAEPRNPDAHLGVWQSHCQDGSAAEGVDHAKRAIEEEVRSGEAELGFAHWREMNAAANDGGPAALRWRLAAVLEPENPAGAIEVLRQLAADGTAGLLAEKARRRLAALGATPPPAASAGPAGAAPPAPPDPAAPLPAPPEPPPEPTVEAAEEPFALGARTSAAVGEAGVVFEDDTGSVQGPPPESGPPTVEVCGLETVQLDGVMLRDATGGCELLPFIEVEKVAVAGITGSGRPYLVLDLVLHRAPGGGRKVERLVSSEFDPRHMVGRPDLAPLQAFRELVRRIAEGAQAELTPATFLVPSAPIPTFASVEEYERAVLATVA